MLEKTHNMHLAIIYNNNNNNNNNNNSKNNNNNNNNKTEAKYHRPLIYSVYRVFMNTLLTSLARATPYILS